MHSTLAPDFKLFNYDQHTSHSVHRIESQIIVRDHVDVAIYTWSYVNKCLLEKKQH